MGSERRSKASACPVPEMSPAGAATMRAAVQHRYGPPSVVEPSEVGLTACPVEARCSSRWARPQYIPATTSS